MVPSRRKAIPFGHPLAADNEWHRERSLLRAPSEMPEIDAVNLRGFGNLEYRAIR